MTKAKKPYDIYQKPLPTMASIHLKNKYQTQWYQDKFRGFVKDSTLNLQREVSVKKKCGKTRMEWETSKPNPIVSS